MNVLNTGLNRNYPNLAKWVTEDSFEIAYEYNKGIVARAFDEEGIVWEGQNYRTLEEAMHALEKGIKTWIEKNFK